MSRLYLFDSEFEDDSLEIIALLAKVDGTSQSDKEKRLGLDFLGLLNDGTNIHYLSNDYILRDYGLNEFSLLDIAEENLNIHNNYVDVAQFYLGEDGYVNIDSRFIDNTKKSSRSSRRYILVEFGGRLYLTDVVGLDQATLHYKDDRERNFKGLQWENFISLLKYGAVYA